MPKYNNYELLTFILKYINIYIFSYLNIIINFNNKVDIFKNALNHAKALYYFLPKTMLFL